MVALSNGCFKQWLLKAMAALSNGLFTIIYFEGLATCNGSNGANHALNQIFDFHIDQILT